MAAFKNSGSSVAVQIAFSFLLLTLAFAHDLSSPAAAPTTAKTEGPSSPGEVSESELAPTPTSVSYIASSPGDEPAASPVPASSSFPEQSLTTSDDGGEGETYEVLETTVTAPVDVPGVPKDIQAQVTNVVQSSVIAVKAQTQDFTKNVIIKRLNDPETEEETRHCLQQCKENYGDAEDDISKVVDDLNTGDYFKAMVDVEGISTFVDTCNDCMKEMVGDDPVFKKFDDWIKGVTGDCLDQLDKLRS